MKNTHWIKLIFVGLILFAQLFGWSQEISVSGSSQGKTGDLVRVLVYADQFSMLEKTIASSQCDALGHFNMNAALPETTYGFLALNLEKGELYLTPGAAYKVEIPQQQSVEQGSVFDKIPLQFDLQVTNDGGLQTDIGMFNSLYNQFIYDNAQVIYRSRNKQAITEFKSEMEVKFKDSKSVYLKNYIHYAFVSLDWLSKRISNAQVLKQEILSKPVLYNNIQYTDFFKSFFDNYLDSYSNRHYDQLIQVLNNPGDYLPLKHMLQQDTLLKSDERVTELAMMLLISRNFYLNEVKKEAVIEKLKILSVESKYKENREIASHFIDKLTQLIYGFPAPEFGLENERGELVDLRSYHGKFVLLNFMSNNCQICLFELDQIQKISANFKGKLDLLTLVVGDDNSQVV
ncbi:MAG: redoxin domain-containing protein, partial [Bacteroidales bacterium]